MCSTNSRKGRETNTNLHGYAVWSEFKVCLSPLYFCGGVIQVTIEDLFGEGEGCVVMLAVLIKASLNNRVIQFLVLQSAQSWGIGSVIAAGGCQVRNSCLISIVSNADIKFH